MPSDIENLRTARSNLIATMAEVSANPKPSYSMNGQQVDWVGFYRFLTDQVAAIDRQLAADDGAFEVVVEGMP